MKNGIAQSLACLLSVCVGMSGCGFVSAGARITEYAPGGVPGRSVGPYALGVLPVEDRRSFEKKGAMIACDFLAPFLPIGSETIPRPEYEFARPAPGQRSLLSLVLWQDLSAELANDRLVDSAFAVSQQPNGFYQVGFDVQPPAQFSPVRRPIAAKFGPPANPQLLLKPTLITADVTRKLYCILPIFGALVFPMLGSPFGSELHRLELKLELVAASDPAKTLWSYDIDESASGYLGFYYATGAVADALDQNIHNLVAAGMSKAVPELASYLAHRPPTFWQKLGTETVAEKSRGEKPRGEKPAPAGGAHPWWQ